MVKSVFFMLFFCSLTLFGQNQSDYKNLKKKYESAKFELDHGDVHYNLTKEVIKDFEVFLLFLKKNQSKNNSYSSEALDVSIELFSYFNWDIEKGLKIKILEFANYFWLILKENKSLVINKKYAIARNEILKSLKEERLKKVSFKKKIKKVESKLKKL